MREDNQNNGIYREMKHHLELCSETYYLQILYYLAKDFEHHQIHRLCSRKTSHYPQRKSSDISKTKTTD